MSWGRRRDAFFRGIHPLNPHGAEFKFSDLCDEIESRIGQHICCTFYKMEWDEDNIPLHPFTEIGFNLDLSPLETTLIFSS
jgi:hypothetical protein